MVRIIGKRKEFITHDDLIYISIKILNDFNFNPMFGKRIGYPVPDAIDEKRNAALECGQMLSPRKRINELLNKYKIVFWIPYPEFRHGIPLFSILKFESVDMNIEKVKNKIKDEIFNHVDKLSD